MVKYKTKSGKGVAKLRTFIKVLKEYFQQLNIKIPEDIIIDNIQMDSKKIIQNSLFIAINNGSNYIEEAILKGASLVITDRENLQFKDEKIIRVTNSIETLQNLAKLYRQNLNIKVIGITGSEGKTTTKDLVYGILSKSFNTKKTLGNFNNQIGLPFTILQLKEENEVAILEMGMSSLGEIDFLCQIAKPDYAIITNIGDSHLEYLINRDNVFKAKTELLKYVDKKNTFVFGDDEYLSKVDALKVGFSNKNNFIITEIDKKFEGSNFKLNNEKYYVPLNGDYNVINASFGIALGKSLGMEYGKIKEALENIEITAMRFEKIIKNERLYINDAYNASPVSMKVALNTFATLPLDKGFQKVVVLGDALELGEKAIEYHIDILNEALKYNFVKVLVFGDIMKKASSLIKNSRIEHFNTKKSLELELQSYKDVAILLKGSRGMKLEEIII